MPLEAKNIFFRYASGGQWLLNNVSLRAEAGESVALVGPSGCGKSTLAKILSGYIRPDGGTVLWNGKPLPQSGFCPVQMIHQHPESAVNPRHRMGRILNEGRARDADLMQAAGIEKEWLSRWPNELSSGELQRFCIARVLGPKTEFLICDEIGAMLDVITQAQIWELVLGAAKRNRLGLIAVTHNRALAERVCDRTITLP
ncbi:MAG: ATP-binding cassette domain-containing protein [Clostridiales Family XIII bacterium]|jgi:peptide/nickel transport system ATP-binding protein|nr:ATP-binding cassette domain-containing protein [Clostridiales Family XIII bacterium]